MHIAPKRLMRMCSRLIEEANYVYEDDLAYISSLCYAAGSYDEVLTAYLVRYYNGTSDKMVALWKSAIEMGVDAYELEERIITPKDLTEELWKHTFHISHICILLNRRMFRKKYSTPLKPQWRMGRCLLQYAALHC